MKYLVPNGITCSSILFSMLGIHAALVGDMRSACWWILYSVLSDKLDGLVARKLNASSPFGAQLDSLADLASFGFAPATLFCAFYSRHPEAGWTSGWQAVALPVIAASYVIATAIRLARFNVIADIPGAERIFFGMPSTFAGGLMTALLCTLLKYGDPQWGGATAGDWPMLGVVRLDGLAPHLPWGLLGAAVAMVSQLRVPKVGATQIRLINVGLISNAVVCFGLGLARRMPEYLAVSALVYFVFSIGNHLLAPSTRGVKPPPLFRQASG